MDQPLYRSARTTDAARLAIYRSQESVRGLAARHGISRLADVRDKPCRSKFRIYAIGYIHSDTAEVRTEEGNLQLFVGIDRTSKLAFVRSATRATYMIACQVLA